MHFKLAEVEKWKGAGKAPIMNWAAAGKTFLFASRTRAFCRESRSKLPKRRKSNFYYKHKFSITFICFAWLVIINTKRFNLLCLFLHLNLTLDIRKSFEPTIKLQFYNSEKKFFLHKMSNKFSRDPGFHRHSRKMRCPSPSALRPHNKGALEINSLKGSWRP